MSSKLPVIKEIHVNGMISIENIPENLVQVGDLGVQISDDGRIWICINGIAFLRFSPRIK